MAYPTKGPKKHLTNSQIKKAFGKKGTLHKKLGIPPKQKIGAAKLRAAAKQGGKIGKEAQIALNFDYSKGKKSRGPKAKGSKGRRRG
jgi:hypothetical protein